MFALTPITQGKSPVRESRTPGSARGVPGDRHPYRDTNSSVKKRKAFARRCGQVCAEWGRASGS
jgi:hypothetical protein